MSVSRGSSWVLPYAAVSKAAPVALLIQQNEVLCCVDQIPFGSHTGAQGEVGLLPTAIKLGAFVLDICNDTGRILISLSLWERKPC